MTACYSGPLTAQRLRELLDYNPTTGVFTRRSTQGTQRLGSIAGGLNIQGYIHISVDGVRYLAHRLAWLYVHGEWPPADLDHKDTFRHHNWISNLRPATQSQNNANGRRRRDNMSGRKGVSYDKENRCWRAQINNKGKQYNLGRFLTIEQAHAAYCAAAVDLYGEFARPA